MVGGGARGLFRIHAVVGVAGLLQAVLVAAPFEELPHATGGLMGHRARDEAGFGLGHVDEFPRHAFFIQDALDHGPVAARALQPANQCLVAASGEVVYVSQDRVVHRQGQLRNRGRHLLPHLVLQPGVHREGHLQDVFQGGLFELALFNAGRGAQARQIQAVDGVHHFIQLALVFLAVGGILVRRVQHRVDGGVEFPAGIPDIVALVVPLTGLKPPIGSLDERIRASPALGELRIGQQEGGNIL